MICPNCNSVNKDDAAVCKKCRLRLAGRRARPESEEREKKYLLVGAACAAAVVVFLGIIIGGFSCACGGCRKNADESAINESVGGDYDVIGSGSDLISGADVTSSDA